ncbi:MAG: hypothetical protein KDJ65_34015 [Anaerolineae bacterium]|nr:hypothetical protein [Anaerolineae bacterium]
MMQSALGWTVLSRDALRRAETHLRDQDEGVRDEIGFLALHQAYADRFFPGTSVLQTRLRYILFVPWMYQSLAHKPSRSQPINHVVQKQELDLAQRLKKRHGLSDGVIGARSLPKPTSQPPTMIYWNALRTWRILRPQMDGTYPKRSAVHRSLTKQHLPNHLTDDDKSPLEESSTFFVKLPPPPAEWNDKNHPLDFTIQPKEAEFIDQHLRNVHRMGMPKTPSLLACLVEHTVDLTNLVFPWAKPILNLVDKDEHEALLRAQQASALAAIGRAIYAALVERICAEEDKRSIPDIHRANLRRVIRDYRGQALRLDTEAVKLDAFYSLPSSLLDVLNTTQSWLKTKKDFSDLRDVYERAEVTRKGGRARLARTLAGQERRKEWTPEEFPEATPLHYRWSNVQRLLDDLSNHG